MGAVHSPAFAGSVVVFFAVTGFLGSYLITRLYLALAFSEADQAASAFKQGIEELTAQSEDDVWRAPVAPSADPPEEISGPLDAITATWRELYLEARDAIERRGRRKAPKLTSNVVARAKELALIDDQQAQTMLELSRLAKKADEASEDSMTPRGANDYRRLAQPLIEMFRQAP